MPIFEEDPNVKEPWEPPWYRDPPTPRIHNRPGNWGRGGMGGFGPFVTTKRKKIKIEEEPINNPNEIGYETDWKYPNWLIRMAQWRNF